MLPGPWALPTGSKNTISIRFYISVVSNIDLPFGVGRIAPSMTREISTAWGGGALQAIAAVTDSQIRTFLFWIQLAAMSMGAFLK